MIEAAIAGFRAFYVAVLAAVGVGLVLGNFVAATTGIISFSEVISPLLVVEAVELAVISAFALGLIGVPLTAVLSWMGRERKLTYPALGCFIGAVIGVLCGGFLFWGFVVAGALAGATAGTIWWRMYRKEASTARPVG